MENQGDGVFEPMAERVLDIELDIELEIELEIGAGSPYGKKAKRPSSSGWGWLVAREACQAKQRQKHRSSERRRRGRAMAQASHWRWNPYGPSVEPGGRQGQLMSAACEGRAVQVALLLEAGADPMVEVNGWTPLIRAASLGHAECVEALVAEGGRDFKGRNGMDALMAAAAGGHWECVAALLQAGADPKATDKDGMDALMLAAAAGREAGGSCQYEVVELLLDCSDAEARDNQGRSALVWAAERAWDAKVVELLLEAWPGELSHEQAEQGAWAARAARSACRPEVELAVMAHLAGRERDALSLAASQGEKWRSSARKARL